MMRRFCCVLIGCLVFAATARGGLYEIPLPALKGAYSTGDVAPGISQSFTIDCSCLARIDAVRLDVSGSVAPPPEFRSYSCAYLTDVAHFGETSGNIVRADTWLCFRLDKGANDFVLPPIEIWADVAEDGAFHVQEAFGGAGDQRPDFSFLMSGQGMVSFSILTALIVDPGRNGGSVFPIVTIADARLIIEGVAVPEPASGLLMWAGVFMLGRRRR